MGISKNAMTLKQFLLRQEVLKAYKNIHRTLNNIEDTYYRNDFKLWARSDFRANKQLKDEIDIKMQLSRARMSLTELETSMKMAK